MCGTRLPLLVETHMLWLEVFIEIVDLILSRISFVDCRKDFFESGGSIFKNWSIFLKCEVDLLSSERGFLELSCQLSRSSGGILIASRRSSCVMRCSFHRWF